MLKSTAVFLSLVCVCFASNFMGLEPKPERFKDVEGCYVSELDQVIPINDIAPMKHDCMGYDCWSEGMALISCKDRRGGSCYVAPEDDVYDYSKPFPDCCPPAQCRFA